MKILATKNSVNIPDMTITEFMTQVVDIYHKYFPNSECQVSTREFAGLKYITIDWYLSANVNEVAHKIRRNDMFEISFDINLEDSMRYGQTYDIYIHKYQVDSDKVMPSEITLDVTSKCYRIASDNKYHAFELRNLPFRKTVGSPNKILSTLDRYAQKLYASVVTDFNNNQIPDTYTSLVSTKL